MLYNTLKLQARAMRENPTEAEALLWSRLRGNALDGAHFRQQHVIQPYIVDFACREFKVVVEVDGSHHGGETDQARDEHLRRLGYDVVRAWNEEVLRETDQVLERIRAAIQASPRPPLAHPKRRGPPAP